MVRFDGCFLYVLKCRVVRNQSPSHKYVKMRSFMLLCTLSKAARCRRKRNFCSDRNAPNLSGERRIEVSERHHEIQKTQI